MWMVVRKPGIGWRTGAVLVFSQLHNLYIVLNLVIMIHLVDVVLSRQEDEAEQFLWVPHSRQGTAILLSVLIIMPLFILHAWDYIEVKLNLYGLVRDFTRENIFRRYLNLSEASRQDMTPAQIMLTITDDSSVVGDAYVALVKLSKAFVKVVVLIIFTMQKNPQAWWVLVAMPVLIFFFAYIRAPISQKAQDAVIQEEVNVTQFVSNTIENYSLVADYSARLRTVDRFMSAARRLQNARMDAAIVTRGNDACANWIRRTFTGFYVVVASPTVMADHTFLGTFLATINVFSEICSALDDIYSITRIILRTFLSLRQITTFLNLPTDLAELKEVHDKRRRETLDAFETHEAPSEEPGPEACDEPVKTTSHVTSQTHEAPAISASGVKTAAWEPVNEMARTMSNSSEETGVPSCDLIPIMLKNVNFSYPGSPPLFFPMSFIAPQGILLAVLGEASTGRETFMRLLNHTRFPTTGEIFVPSHLRVVFVSKQPYFTHQSLWSNLTFGRTYVDMYSAHDSSHQDFTPQRVREIARLLRMTPGTLQRLDDDLKEAERTGLEASYKEVQTNPCHYYLPATDLAKVHLARALIGNPELMIVHDILIHFLPKEKDFVLKLLSTHVQERGLALPSWQSDAMRRPRTVFATVETAEQAELADKAICLLPNREHRNGSPKRGEKRSRIWTSSLSPSTPTNGTG